MNEINDFKEGFSKGSQYFKEGLEFYKLNKWELSKPLVLFGALAFVSIMIVLILMFVCIGFVLYLPLLLILGILQMATIQYIYHIINGKLKNEKYETNLRTWYKTQYEPAITQFIVNFGLYMGTIIIIYPIMIVFYLLVYIAIIGGILNTTTTGALAGLAVTPYLILLYLIIYAIIYLVIITIQTIIHLITIFIPLELLFNKEKDQIERVKTAIQLSIDYWPIVLGYITFYTLLTLIVGIITIILIITIVGYVVGILFILLALPPIYIYSTYRFWEKDIKRITS